jgi:large subunit ribosomal protein L21
MEEGRNIPERLLGEVGDVIELGDVLLMDAEGALTVGAPTITGARVMGTIAEQGRSKKIVVFRYKAKTRYRKKTGHRQHFTTVVVDDILLPGQEPRPKQAAEPAAEEVAAAPTGRRGRKAATAAVAQEETTAAVPGETLAEDALEEASAETVETTAPETEAKPKRGRKKAE